MDTPSRSGKTTSGKPTRLLDRVVEWIRVKQYSRRTEEAYVHWIKRFVLFYGKRHPTEMGGAAVEALLSTLAVDRNVAASTQNVALAGELVSLQGGIADRLALAGEYRLGEQTAGAARTTG